MRPDRCEQWADDLPELALGILPGRERMALLRHLDSCEPCRAALEHLTQAADALLLVAPKAEPPLGFEQRVAGAMATAAPARHSGRRRRALVAVAAAVAVLGLGFGIGWLAGGSGRGHGAPVAQARGTGAVSGVLTSDGEVYGKVVITPGSNGRAGWLDMSVEDLAWDGANDGQVKCAVTLAGGGRVVVGSFWLRGGSGAWGAPMPEVHGTMRGAEVLAADGSVLASATLH